jgi:hypothetical protein
MPPSRLLHGSAAGTLSSEFDRDDQEQKKDHDENDFIHYDLLNGEG